jgi:NAD(P)H dehydrogenase (quinone)
MQTDKNKILIVFGHPERKSFCGQLLINAQSVLEAQGHEVKVSDLYRMDFKANLSQEDFKAISKEESGPVNYEQAQTEASKNNSFSDQTSEEIDKVLFTIFFNVGLSISDAIVY